MNLRLASFVGALALALAPAAHAGGGHYSFDGGTRAQQAQVTSALEASSFDWGIVPGRVVVHIAPNVISSAQPDEIWLDARLLDSGRFSWGVVQHEYAHQVDFAVLDDARRAQLQAVVGGSAWCAGAPHAQLGCERFADLVAWAYWQSPDNVMRPSGAADEGGGVAPAAFRASLARILAVRSPAAAVRRPHRNG